MFISQSHFRCSGRRSDSFLLNMLSYSLYSSGRVILSHFVLSCSSCAIFWLADALMHTHFSSSVKKLAISFTLIQVSSLSLSQRLMTSSVQLSNFGSSFLWLTAHIIWVIDRSVFSFVSFSQLINSIV